MSSLPQKILLLDVSHLFFRAFYAFPKTLTDKDSKPINAVFGVAQMLFSAIENHQPDYIFGGKDLAKKTFRSEKLPEYKAQRPTLDPDLRDQIPRVYDFLDAFSLPVFSIEGYEADDMIACMAEKYRGDNNFIVEVLTGDADSFQLIGQNVSVLKPGRKGEESFTRDVLFEKKGFYPEEVVDFKAMAGDSSDNLKGVAGIGEKGAIKLIREFGDLENIYKALETGQISGATAKKLKEGRDSAFFTRELATLHRDLLLEGFDLEKGHINHFTVDRLLSFFEDIGSNSLQNRVRKIFKDKIKSDKQSVTDAQIEMF